MIGSPFDVAMQKYSEESKKPSSPPNSEPKQQTYNNDPAKIESNPFNVAESIYKGQANEGWIDEATRDVVRTGSRMVETILGLPGDLVQFGKFIGNKLPDAGKMKGSDLNFVQKLGSSALDKLPTQGSLQSLSEEFTSGYTTPRGGGEDFSDEIFKTFSGLLGGGSSTFARGATNLPRWGQAIARMGRNLGMSVAAQSAKEGIKLFGGSEAAQEWGKLGSLLLLGMGLPRLTRETNPSTYLSSLYRERDALIPRRTMITPTGLQSNLQNFINTRLRYGGPTPEKTQVLGVAEDFLHRIDNRALPMDELLQMYRDINRNRSSVMSVKDIDKPGRRAARAYYGELAGLFNESIEGYLGTISPPALQIHRQANGGWASLAQSQAASEFILDKARDVPLKTGIASLFGGGIFYNPSAVAKTLGAAGMAGGGAKATQLAFRMVTNPTLRHYYNHVVVNAMKENGPETIKALKKLDEYYERELKNPKSNVNRPLPPLLEQTGNPQQKKNPRLKDTSVSLYQY